MYASPVRFVSLPVGPGPARVAWTPPAGDDAVEHYLVFRSTCPIPPEMTEAFYAGELARCVTRFDAPAAARLFVDEAPPGPCWYLVLACDAGGNLLEVDHRVETPPAEPRAVPPHTPAACSGCAEEGTRNTYRDLPEIVYRRDDAAGVVSMRTIAGSLGQRFGGPSGEKDAG